MIGRLLHWDFLNEYSGAIATSHKAIEIADYIGDKSLATTSRLNLAVDYFDRGNFDECQIQVAEASRSAQESGDQDNEAYAWFMQGSLHRVQKIPQDAIDKLHQALERSKQIGSEWLVANILSEFTLSYLSLPDLSSAQQYAVQSLLEAEKGSESIDLGVAHEAIARVEAASRNWPSAILHFNEAINNYQQAECHLYVATTQRNFAEAMLLQGGDQQKAQAINMIRAALAVFQKLNIAHEITEAQLDFVHLVDKEKKAGYA